MKTQMLTLSLPSNELFLSLIFPTLACFPLACCFVKHHHCALFNATNYLYRFLSCSFSPLLLVFCLHAFHFPLACRFVKHHHHALFNATNYLYRFLSRSFSLLSLVFRLHVISLSTVIALFSMQQTISTDFSLAHFPHSRSFSTHTPFC